MTTFRVALLALAALPLAASVGGTGLAQQPAPLVLHLRDPSGNPVKDATGSLTCEPPQELVALRGLDATHHVALDAPTTISSTSDENGMLRFPAAAGRAGKGVVTTAQGLGAIIGRLRPGQAQRVTMAPMAEVTTATGSEAFTLWARTTLADGEVVTLPPVSGNHVRLPAGDHEIWARSQDGWIWQRLHLESSRRAVLQFAGPAQRLESRAGAWIHPRGWPGLPLVAPGEGATLLGTELAAPLTAGVPAEGLVVADRALPMPPSREPIVWPPARPGAATDSFGLAASVPAAAAELFALRRSGSANFHVEGAARLDGERRFLLPASDDGDIWLLLVVPGHAPFATPRSLVRPGAQMAPPRGLPLVVHAKDEGGDPAVDLVVDYVPLGGEAATVRARSDARGKADLGLVGIPGRVLLSDPRFANQDFDVDQVPSAGLTIVVQKGERITGIVRLADGTPAGDTLVTLRDPSGKLRPAERSMLCGADGTFAFGGLTATSGFVLFASARRSGRTWSGQRTRLTAGGEAVVVELRDEDPQLRHEQGR